MRLLIVTQIVDIEDPILGFFHRWLLEFAKHVEVIEIICLKRGVCHLPQNVRVHSLGKEQGEVSTLVYTLRFLVLVWRLRKSYDSVFVHMNTEYVILAGWLWRILGKRISLWYTHGTVSLQLYIANVFANVLLTASEQSLRLATPKKKVMGHGLDTDRFPLTSTPNGPLRLLTVGRLSPVKNLHILIDAFAVLNKSYPDATLTLLGGPATLEDAQYVKQLHVQSERLGVAKAVIFKHANANLVPEELSQAHLFLHASATGSLDKAPLEALLSGVPVITVNPEIAGIISHAYLSKQNVSEFQETLLEVVAKKPWQNISARKEAHTVLATHYGLPSLVQRIVNTLQSVSK